MIGMAFTVRWLMQGFGVPTCGFAGWYSHCTCRIANRPRPYPRTYTGDLYSCMEACKLFSIPFSISISAASDLSSTKYERRQCSRNKTHA